MKLDDLTLGDLADAMNELRRLREQVTDLQTANTREVERRRRVEVTAKAVMDAHYDAMTIDHIPLDAAIDALAAAIGACPICGAFGGLPCRTENVGAALPTPHEGRGRELLGE